MKDIWRQKLLEKDFLILEKSCFYFWNYFEISTFEISSFGFGSIYKRIKQTEDKLIVVTFQINYVNVRKLDIFNKYVFKMFFVINNSYFL
jgi:hypothetical protein